MDLEIYRNKALDILSPIKTVDNNTKARKDFLFSAKKSNASRNLPEYYLVYFLFADLLGFKNLGKFEKIAWSFPIDYKGKAFLIEYRKFGVGVFIQDKDIDEKDAGEIAKKINGAVKSARPFFDYIALQSIKGCELNIQNYNEVLYERCVCLRELYANICDKIKNDERSNYVEYRKLTLQSKGLFISYIEAFFSWTEHLFIHLAVLGGNITNGEELSDLVGDDWKNKFKKAIPQDKITDSYLGNFLIIRQQLRNFIAHGSFGKNYETFQFHSGTGAVPIYMNFKKQKNRFSLNGSLSFNNQEVLKLIDEFIVYLFEGPLSQAMLYTQKHDLPTIMTLATNGRYLDAIKNSKSMEMLIAELTRQIDDSANMDW